MYGNDVHLVEKIAVLSLYMLREGTAVPAVWFSIELIFGLFALKNGPEAGRDSSTFTKPGYRDH